MSELVTVLAASGRQGRAVVHALLTADRPVRAVVRDPDRDDARHLADAGAEVVPGSLDDIDGIEQALRGAAGMFLFQPNFVSPQVTPGIGPDDETRRGRAIVDAAVRAGIRHVVYSSALGADRPDVNALARPKAQLEEYLRSTQIPATVLRPVGFMENYLGPLRGLQPNGMLASTAPPDATEQLIAVADIGSFAARAFTTPADWIGRAMDITADELTTPEIADAIAAATGRAVRYQNIPIEEIRAQDPQLAAIIARMYSEDRPTADLRKCRAAITGLTTFNTWLRMPRVTEAFAAYLSEADPA
ncbi:NmrA/HSCARG family protein [Nocardia sp. NPDC101769]|uniref:NmrA/HSCARG family protein n=1 Tax=Nocardia sp. NPDC101769 TaxID=3364333 RepID=UPI003805073E